MSQVLIPPPIKPSIRTTTTTTTVADSISTSEVLIAVMGILMNTSPIRMIGNKLRVNENVLEENRIYSITHNGQEYFVRRKKGVTEIFQLSD